MRLGRYEVPLDRDASARFLPWLIAFMVYLAALALSGAIATHKVMQRWDRGLSGQLTVEVPPAELADGAREAAARLERVLGILDETPGVTGATAYGPEDVAALLEPWLGGGLPEAELPLPRLIAVTVDRSSPPDLDGLADRLHAAVPGTSVDDHQRWFGNLIQLARSLQVVCAVVVVLVGGAAVSAVIFVTRTGLSVHEPVIEILHLIGAQDAYIARQFQRHAFRLGLRGSLWGTALALATVLPVAYLLTRAQSLPVEPLDIAAPEWALLAVLPVLAALIAMVTARLTVLGTLARLP